VSKLTAHAKPIEVTIFDGTKEESYKPMPKQGDFHGLPHKYRCFAGGWGNGKTAAGCAEALMLALEYPGSTGLIARKTRPELKATTQYQFFNGGGGNPKADWTGCPQELIRNFNKSEQRLTLINGSVIHFWPLDDPDKLSNLNLGWFLIDQAEEVPEEMFQMLQGRLRQLEAPRKGIILCNPAGHDWIWRRWVHLTYPDHGLIHATTHDNPNLPADYVESLMNMPEAWVKRFVHGSWEVFEGQIWPEFDPDAHTMAPFQIPNWYEGVEGIDHGRRNPTAVLFAFFAQMHGHDYCFVVDEHYEAGQLVGYHAERLLEKRIEWGEPLYTVIDASAAQEDPNTGRSVMDEYYDYGIVTVPSDRHVVARINRVAEWLRLDPNIPHPVTGETREQGWPRLFIFKNCVHLIEHIQQYQWKKKPPTKEEDAKEEPLKKDDHDVDTLGYILMTRPPPGQSPEGNPTSKNQWYWDRIRARIEGRATEVNEILGSEA